MEKIGLIMEGNPFHNGHRYFIEEIKKKYPNSLLIVVMTSSFTMRGEVSIIDKFQKVKAFLNHHIDLVFELPFTNSCQGSDYFATTSVKILNDLHVDKIICGSECDDLSVLTNIYNITTRKDFDQYLSSTLKENSYKVALSKALKHFNYDDNLINLPNFTLSLAYYKAINKINPKIEFELIKRTNDYYKLSNHTKITSATSIRDLLLEGNDVSSYLPMMYNFIDLKKSNDLLYLLFKFHIRNYEEEIINDSEGFNNYLKKYLYAKTYDEYLQLTCNKKYTKAKVRRQILHLLLGTKYLDNLNYLRLLGSNEIGLKYLNSLDKEIKKEIFSSPKELDDNDYKKTFITLELKATKLYETITGNDILIDEYKLPIRK